MASYLSIRRTKEWFNPRKAFKKITSTHMEEFQFFSLERGTKLLALSVVILVVNETFILKESLKTATM